MRRSATEVLRRGIDNVLANWPLLLIRVAEGVVLLALVAGAIVAVIIPVVVSLGIHGFETQPIDAIDDLLALMASKWLTIVWMLVAFTGGLLVAMIVHSFVEAGNAAIYVDAERAPTLRAFTMDRWLAAARSGTWRVFWIYNATWAAGMTLVLIPLLVLGLLMILFRESAAAIAIGCFGIVVSVMFLVVVAVATHFWTQKAIVVAVARALPVTEALGEAWREIRDDLGRHAAVAVTVFAITIGGAMFLSAFSMMFRTGDDWLNFAFVPAQMVISTVQTAFSAATSAWLLASLAGLTVDRRA